MGRTGLSEKKDYMRFTHETVASPGDRHRHKEGWKSGLGQTV